MSNLDINTNPIVIVITTNVNWQMQRFELVHITLEHKKKHPDEICIDFHSYFINPMQDITHIYIEQK